jgi:hypothetical protein
MSRRWLTTGVVEAPVHDVFAALLAVGPTEGTYHSPLDGTDTGGSPDGIVHYSVAAGDAAYTVAVEVDHTRHMLSVQGHWWYRGVYTVSGDRRGSLLEYRVSNIATRGRWMVPIMQRDLPRRMRRDLGTLLRAIGRYLDRPTYLNP